MGPRVGLNGCGKSRPHRDSIPGQSSPLRAAIPTTLSRLTRVIHFFGPLCLYIYIYIYTASVIDNHYGCIGGMTLKTETMSHCHYAHHRAQVNWSGIAPVSQQYKPATNDQRHNRASINLKFINKADKRTWRHTRIFFIKSRKSAPYPFRL